jgi:hypothetical protein
MTRRLVISLPLMVAAVAVGSAAAALNAASAKPTVISTVGAIEALAMDGNRVAYDLQSRGVGCNTVHVWDTKTKKDAVVSGPSTCNADLSGTGAGVRELVVAGPRVAWIVNLGGNTESIDTLYAATVGGAKEKKLATALRTGDVDGALNGKWLGNLAGDGDLIALNRWTTAGGAIGVASISRLKVGLAAVHTGPESLRVVSADSGRVAVLDPQGRVRIYDAGGEPLSSFEPNGHAKEVVIRKDYVVVLVPGALEIHGTLSGALIDTLPISPGARALDVHANVAVYVTGKTIRAVRLATMKETAIAVTPKRVVGVEIDDAGLAYAYNTVTGVNGLGKLWYLPLSLVQAKLSQAEKAA